MYYIDYMMSSIINIMYTTTYLSRLADSIPALA